MSTPPAITYVTALYPAVSVRFIQREVEALRSHGVMVDVVSVRTPTTADVRSPADRRSFSETTYLRPVRPGVLVGAHLRAVARTPVGYVRTLLEALRRGGWDARQVVWQAFYFAQAMLLWWACEQRGQRRLHVHFANVAADIAMLAVTFGRREQGDAASWSWTLSMHGPTEFADVARFNLAEKASSASLVACISHYCRSQLMAITPPDVWERFTVIRLGVESDFGDITDGRADRRVLDDADDVVRLLSVGRLVPEKGFATLLQALAQLPEALQWSLQLVGAGPEEEKLRSLAIEKNIASRIHFRGALGNDRVRQLYGDTDVFCLASFAEGLPVVLMEAMAAGLPVVTTRIAAIPELVVDGETGLLASPGDVAGLARSLSVLLQDAVLRLHMGQRGRERVKRLHGIEANTALLADFLRRVHQLETRAPTDPSPHATGP